MEFTHSTTNVHSAQLLTSHENLAQHAWDEETGQGNWNIKQFQIRIQSSIKYVHMYSEKYIYR